ncbi:Acyl-CoA--sterol O-acyltransferase 1 [Linum grandiflorum]
MNFITHYSFLPLKNQTTKNKCLSNYRVDMNKELQTLINVWSTIFLSLSFCHLMGKLIVRRRLLFISPVVGLFLFLPLTIRSAHLSGMTGFFISWLANFKLLLFAFDRGPLSSSSSLLRFVAVACMPLKVYPPRPPSSRSSASNHSESVAAFPPPPRRRQSRRKSPLNYIAKAVVFASLSWAYERRAHLHWTALQIVYSVHIYCFLEICLVISSVAARLTIGSELEPSFNEPYLSTSLQDYWGKRWNLTVSSIMRPAVYDPTLAVLLQKQNILGLHAARLVAVWATFVVSGLMHELMYYYLTRHRPTLEVFCFFLLHGTCLVAEVYFKKVTEGRDMLWRRWWWRPVANMATIGFVTVIGYWLFFPQLIRSGVDVRVIDEYVTARAWIIELFRKILFI